MAEKDISFIIWNGNTRSLLLPFMESSRHMVSERNAGGPFPPKRQDKDGEMCRE